MDNERKLNVKWSTQEWAPPIKFVPGNPKAERLPVELLRLTFARPKPRKRRPLTVLWVRGGARNGSRPTWR